jgi:TRAP-type C4-dicarboxylate transport system permease small subunit
VAFSSQPACDCESRDSELPSPSSRPERGRRFFRALDSAELFIANTALVIICLTICWNVVSRYMLKTPVAWAEDVTSISFAWFIFIGMVAVHNRRGHISIDIAIGILPDIWRRFIERAVDLFVMVVCAYTAYLCGLQTVVSHTTAQMTVLNVPLSALFASLTLGFALMALRSGFFVLGLRPDVEKV